MRNGSFRRIGIKAALDLLPARSAGQSVDYPNAFLGLLRALYCLSKDLPQVELGTLAVLREDQHAPRIPPGRRTRWPLAERAAGRDTDALESSRSRRLVLLSGRCFVSSAMFCIRSSSSCSCAHKAASRVRTRISFGCLRQTPSLGCFFLFDLLVRPLAALVVRTCGFDEEIVLIVGWHGIGVLGLRLGPVPDDRLAMHSQTARERLDGRKEPLL